LGTSGGRRRAFVHDLKYEIEATLSVLDMMSQGRGTAKVHHIMAMIAQDVINFDESLSSHPLNEFLGIVSKLLQSRP
jgi:hypothetical protein